MPANNYLHCVCSDAACVYVPSYDTTKDKGYVRLFVTIYTGEDFRPAIAHNAYCDTRLLCSYTSRPHSAE